MSSREKLLAATLRCLRELGHERCTVMQIAQFAGVNHGLVHHYFGSKEALLVAALEDLSAMVESRFTGKAVVEDFIVPVIFSDPGISRIMLEYFAMAGNMPAVKTALKDFITHRHQILSGLLGTRDRAILTLFLAGIFGLALHNNIDPDLPVGEGAQLLHQMILGEIAGRSEGP